MPASEIISYAHNSGGTAVLTSGGCHWRCLGRWRLLGRWGLRWVGRCRWLWGCHWGSAWDSVEQLICVMRADAGWVLT